MERDNLLRALKENSMTASMDEQRCKVSIPDLPTGIGGMGSQYHPRVVVHSQVLGHTNKCDSWTRKTRLPHLYFSGSCRNF